MIGSFRAWCYATLGFVVIGGLGTVLSLGSAWFAPLLSWLTLAVVFPMVLGLAIWLSIRLRFLQFRGFFAGLRLLIGSSETGGNRFSQAQALAAILAGNCGTGNISGMAVALTTGGPGALVWMWIAAYFGSIVQYASCVLGSKYRQPNGRGEWVSGPMYYLSQGLKKPKLAIAFSIAVIFAAAGMGGAQVNSIILALQPIGCPSALTVMLLMIATGAVILGGAKRLARVSSTLVPLMATLYLGSAFCILGFHIRELPAVMYQLLEAALSPHALFGGTLGYSCMHIITTGFGRALFATDVGTGYIPILQGGARSRHPVIEGYVSFIAPFMVMIVCTTTALVLLVTGASQTAFQSTAMVLYAFQASLGAGLGKMIVALSILLFGYTTLIAWGLCLERAYAYVCSGTDRRVCLIAFICLIPMSSVLSVQSVWLLADLTLAVMTVLNLIGIAGLAREVVIETHSYDKLVTKPAIGALR